MPRTYYPLTPAQLIHHHPIQEYGTQQVANICISMTLQAPIDFGMLKHCIQLEYERSEFLRIRFTKPDKNGEVKQYIAAHEDRDIRWEDLTHMSLEEADAVLLRWSSQVFEGDNCPMNEFVMISLPEGYNGIFLRIDHRLVDSCGVIVMVNDLMELYCHFRFGTDYPSDLFSYTEMVERDLAKAQDSRRQEKDRRFWQETLETMGEPIYADILGQKVLQESRRRHGDKGLRAADREMKNLGVDRKIYHLEPDATQHLMDFCLNNQVSMTNLILLGIRTYLSRCNGGQADITVRNYVSRRSTHAEWTSGGTRTFAYPCRTIIEPDTEFMDALLMVQEFQNHVYRHSNYDPALLAAQMQELYPIPPLTAYDSVGLTYQPLPIRLKNEHLKGIHTRSVWYPNGTAIQKVYLTVMHSANDLGLDFYFRYQTAELTEHDMELFYYYLMRILFRGIAEPDMTIGEIIRTI